MTGLLDPPATVHATIPESPSEVGAAIAVRHAAVVEGGTAILDDVSVALAPGTLVAVVGPSGSGKSTLLGLLAGLRPLSSGSVTVDGAPAAPGRGQVSFVPQDDVIHTELPLRRMLWHAARLRLPGGRSTIAAACGRVLRQVDLTHRSDVRVGDLSGGERRRASIAVELLTSPGACLLDEPTSGLDPGTADVIVGELRQLADDGRTVAFATHHAADLRRCDRVVAVVEGRIVFDGSIDEAIERAGSTDIEDVHRHLTGLRTPVDSGRAIDAATPLSGPVRRTSSTARPSRWRQWSALTVRTAEGVVRNRLTAGIMVGAPAMVIAMFAVLFRPDAFDPTAPTPTAAVMITFWVAFGGFFFGLTYGLLQICPEIDVVRREHRSGVSAPLQVLAKMSALVPLLAAVNVGMLFVLRGFDRLPTTDAPATGRLVLTMTLGAVAALALGLLTSSLVRTPAQASLALPMLCFPAVLFSGAIVPVPVMATAGRWISAAMPDRWSFDAIGADLGLRELLRDDPEPLGRSLLGQFGDTWTQTHPFVWTLLALTTVGLTVATSVSLGRRCRAR